MIYSNLLGIDVNMDSYMEKKLKDTINCIFQDYNNDLSLYEKRKMVFDYLVDNLKYDYELLDKIKDFKVSIKRFVACSGSVKKRLKTKPEVFTS